MRIFVSGRGGREGVPVVRPKRGRLAVWGSGAFASIKFGAKDIVYRSVVHHTFFNPLPHFEKRRIIAPGRTVIALHGSAQSRYSIDRCAFGMSVRLALCVWGDSFGSSASIGELETLRGAPSGPISDLVAWCKDRIADWGGKGAILIEGDEPDVGTIEVTLAYRLRAFQDRYVMENHHVGLIEYDTFPFHWSRIAGKRAFLDVQTEDNVTVCQGSLDELPFPISLKMLGTVERMCCREGETARILALRGQGRSCLFDSVTPESIRFLPWNTPMFRGVAVFLGDGAVLRLTIVTDTGRKVYDKTFGRCGCEDTIRAAAVSVAMCHGRQADGNHHLSETASRG